MKDGSVEGVLTTDANLDALQADTPRLGTFVRAMGLPVDWVHLINGRLAFLISIDYEEGRQKPLVCRMRVWPDDFKRDGPWYTDQPKQTIGISRDGTRHEI
jgi:hypothetical protein